MTKAEMEELRMLLILAKMKQNEQILLRPSAISQAVKRVLNGS